MKLFRQLSGLILCVLFLTPTAALAYEVQTGCAMPTAFKGKTFYVDPVHGANNGDGSSARPYHTLAEVLSAKLVRYTDKTGKVMNPNAPIKGGDRILLRTGFHGVANLRGMYNADFLTVAADAGARPVLQSANLSSSSKIILQGVVVQGGGITARGTAATSPLENIIIDGNTSMIAPEVENWSPAQWAAGTAVSGVMVQGNCIAITNNTVKLVHFGIAVVDNSKKVLIKGNMIDFFADDGIRFGATDDMTIKANRITNHYGKLLDGNHNDGIQGWDLDNTPSINLVIDGNTVIETTGRYAQIPPHTAELSTQDYLQGISIFDGTWKNIRVTNNMVVASAYHGLSFYGVNGGFIANNTVMSSFPSTVVGIPNIAKRAWIGLFNSKKGVVPVNVVMRNNVARFYAIAAGTNIVKDHNITVVPGGATDTARLFRTYDPLHATYDLSPAVNSPLLNAGNPDGVPAVDIVNTIRGYAVEAGAYEMPGTKAIRGTVTIKASGSFTGQPRLFVIADGKIIGMINLVKTAVKNQVLQYALPFDVTARPAALSVMLDAPAGTSVAQVSLPSIQYKRDGAAATDLIVLGNPVLAGAGVAVKGRAAGLYASGSNLSYNVGGF